LISIFADDVNNNRFTCTESLPPNCGAASDDINACPSETECIFTTDYGDNSEFYSCGLVCGGSICSLAGAQQINPNYVVYCDSISDQCGICASEGSLSDDENTGGCSQPISAFPPSPTYAMRRRAEIAQKKLEIWQDKEDLGCPVGTRKCGSGDHIECVDTDSDIDSCGGCPGEGGIACYDLPGTVMGDATCAGGMCVSTRCEDGYALWQNSCVLPEVAARFQNATTLPTRTVYKETLSRKRKTRRDGSRYKITDRKQGEIRWWQNVTIVAE
jgi:hypothetical protein